MSAERSATRGVRSAGPRGTWKPRAWG